MVRRLLQLYTGLALYGISTAMFVRADLGADPWNVFHLGVARIFSLNIGMVMILVGALVLLLWIPLRQRPGLGTVSNVVVLGLAADAALAVMPPLESLVARGVLLAAAVAVNAIATGMYIGAGFGAGPRDGLMTGIHARTGWSVRSIRTAIEVTVLLAGWAMGGTFGVGTVLYALTIGPLIQLCLPWFRAQSPMVAGVVQAGHNS
ncbi:YczE/YyaS/YitT family protein [Franconibacter pulveris]|uniref:membrane protein YczE n=1 Tax=Franconibacter pulveris TaxID=435910 RepID=UPI000495E1BA|nr:membrane protein [Franconibacter pulveris]